MRRREFITLLGSLATWPFAACAQQSVPLVGFVNSSSAQAQAAQAAAFRRGLEDSGFVEGKNVLIERRWADGQYSRLPGLIADLIERNAAVLVAGGPPAAQAAKKATSTIPIVFTSGDDPVQTGLVSSINKPGGNVTGVHIFFTEAEPKKLGLLRELVPNADLIVALGGCSADDLPENADSDARPWVMELKRSLTLQHKLLSAVGWPTDCRAAYEANLKKAKQELREARELVKHPDGGIGTGCDPVTRRERLAEVDYRKRLLAGLGKDKATAK